MSKDWDPSGDTAGNLLYVTEKPHQPVQVGAKEKEILAEWALNNERSKWILEAYPDTLNALYSLEVFPNGWPAAFRISGPKEIEIDVFDMEGRLLYTLELPRDSKGRQIPADIIRTGFYKSGLYVQETRDDLPVYMEYRITNVPDIFR